MSYRSRAETLLDRYYFFYQPLALTLFGRRRFVGCRDEFVLFGRQGSLLVQVRSSAGLPRFR